MSEANNGSKKRVRLSKDIWLKHTLSKIGEVGVAGIQIESLAKELNVTKGSFYWHFQDRETLLCETLSSGDNSATKAIGLAGKRDFDDPLDRLRYFYTLALNRRHDVPGGSVERALQEWARVSEIAAETTRRVNQDRISLISDAYIELGKREHQARQTATMALAQIIGLNILSRSQTKRCHAEDTKAFLAVFLPVTVGREPPKTDSTSTTGATASTAG
jgi:AcrR family transcriptional regulator